MELTEFNQIKSQIVGQTKHLTLSMLGWDDVIRNAESHPPYESGQIDEHFNSAFEAVLSPDVFARIRYPERQQKKIRLGEHSLTIVEGHMIHGLEDIHGVDLVYYIRNAKGENQKVAAFQHKKRQDDGSIALKSREKLQNDKIARLCRVCTWYDVSAAYILSQCTSFYMIGDRTASLPNVVSTCMLKDYPNSNAYPDGGNFPLVLDRNTIDVMFLACIVGDNGQRNDPDILSVETMKDVWLASQHVIVEAFLDLLSTRKIRRVLSIR